MQISISIGHNRRSPLRRSLLGFGFGLGLAAAAMTASAQAQPAPDAAPGMAPKPRAPRVAGTSHVRVLHAIVGGPSVDVYLDGKRTLQAVNYKTLSPYMDVPSGSHVVALRAAGSEATAAPIVTMKRSLAADGYFVIAAASVAGKPALLAQNETTGKINEKRASIRFYHLSPDAPAVSITAPSTSKMATNGMRTVVKDLLPGKSRAASLPAGSVTLSINAGGKVVKQVPVTLVAGQRYAAFAIGKAGATGDEALEVMLQPVGK